MESELISCPTCGKQFSQKGIGSHIWRMHGNGKDFDPNKHRVYTSSWSKGLTKETNATLRRMSEERKHTKTPLEAKLDDDGKLRHKWIQKKHNAHREQHLEFYLSFDEFCQLMDDAGITSSQLGIALDRYVLARKGDTGPYEIGNCRFITQRENMIERNENHGWITHDGPAYKQLSPEEKAVREAARKERAEQRAREAAQKAEDRLNFEKFHDARIAELEKERISKLNPSHAGARNSHYGTFWITNGSENKIWRDSNGLIPEGFYRGRYFPKGAFTKKNDSTIIKFWITDGIISKLWSEDKGAIPAGFHKGRMFKLPNSQKSSSN